MLHTKGNPINGQHCQEPLSSLVFQGRSVTTPEGFSTPPQDLEKSGRQDLNLQPLRPKGNHRLHIRAGIPVFYRVFRGTSTHAPTPGSTEYHQKERPAPTSARAGAAVATMCFERRRFGSIYQVRPLRTECGLHCSPLFSAVLTARGP